MIPADRLRRPRATRLRDDRRRRAAGGPDLGVAGPAVHARLGRDHGHRRPQQDPVRHLGAPGRPTSATSRPSSPLRLGASRAVDGHDVEALAASFGDAARADPGPPKVIIADTVKGRASSCSSAHLDRRRCGAVPVPLGRAGRRTSTGKPPKNSSAHARTRLATHGRRSESAWSGRASGSGAGQRPAEAAVRRLRRARSSTPPPASHEWSRSTPTSILDTGLIPTSRERFPDRFVECGIAEQDMVSQAGGLALGGLLPVGALVLAASSLRGRTSRSTTTPPRARRIVYVGSLAGVVPGRARPLAPGGPRHLR